jgi:hypothetical protein
MSREEARRNLKSEKILLLWNLEKVFKFLKQNKLGGD